MQDTNSEIQDMFLVIISHLEYQQCGSSFKFTVMLKSTEFLILNLGIFYVSRHNCKLKISIFNIADDLAEGGLYSLRCSEICS